MRKIYEVGGILNKDFVGQISYTVCLDKEYKEMDIEFSFDKQRHTTISAQLKKELVDACDGEYGAETASDDKVTDAIKGMKTEIHTIAMMNDVFIGGIHKQLTTRHMYFSALEASDGCIPQESIHGVVKITIVVFNVILDDTHYKLSLWVN